MPSFSRRRVRENPTRRSVLKTSRSTAHSFCSIRLSIYHTTRNWIIYLMAGKRKRVPSLRGTGQDPRKRVRIDLRNKEISVKHPTLSLYYSQILTLRNYLLSKLPAASKTRRRRIASAGRDRLPVQGSTEYATFLDAEAPQAIETKGGQATSILSESQDELANLLDHTLVCVTDLQVPKSGSSRAKDFTSYSQQVSLTAGRSMGEGYSSQADVCLRHYTYLTSVLEMFLARMSLYQLVVA